jgi:hypothetical protein
MVDRVFQEFSRLVDAFAEMRQEMHLDQKYSGKVAATNRLYEAIRKFAPEIGLVPPFIPLDPDDRR